MSNVNVQSVEGLNFTEYIADLDFGSDMTLKLRTGKLAKQASGAVLASVGDTVVLCAVVVSEKESDRDFFPLMVDYREKFYAGGRIPGGFFKREARPSDGETLRARLIDRTLRPMFPKGFKNEVQVYITILSSDSEHPAELVAMCGASAALHISQAPFSKPIAGVRIGMIDDEFIVNPTRDQILKSDLDLIVAGHADGINMVEAGALEIDEETMVEALELAQNQIKSLCSGMDALRKSCGKPNMEFEVKKIDKDILGDVVGLIPPYIKEIQESHEKNDRDAAVKKAVIEITAALADKYPEREDDIADAVNLVDEKAMRRRVVKDGIRADGRKTTEIRPVWSEIDVLPSVHGSSVFTRGQTQALAIVTLGSVSDKQMIDDMTGVSFKHFLMHYNFPSYSVGECRMPRGPGRREIGHGALAERALTPMIPTREEFPYTIRSVVEILESNGSSSMATVCSTSMALMDAGVPLKRPVAGIAMGLISDDEGNLAVLTDIQGIEDHVGDMDFKVAGTTEGITALQMDIKIEGITREVLARALDQAKVAREFLLQKMAEAIDGERQEMKPHVPRVTIVKVPVDKIAAVIGPSGKVIKGIVEKTGAKVDIEDDGSCFIMGENKDSSDAAVQMVKDIIRDIKPGEVITGPVVKVTDIGAIVQLTPNKDGMVHISELEHRRVETVDEILKVGDTVTVKVMDVDKMRGRIRLSRKALIEREGAPAGGEEEAPRERRPPSRRPPREGGGDADRRQRRPRPPRD
jgi:polyribonucleotide nucleotidyltransferase